MGARSRVVVDRLLKMVKDRSTCGFSFAAWRSVVERLQRNRREALFDAMGNQLQAWRNSFDVFELRHTNVLQFFETRVLTYWCAAALDSWRVLMERQRTRSRVLGRLCARCVKEAKLASLSHTFFLWWHVYRQTAFGSTGGESASSTPRMRAPSCGRKARVLTADQSLGGQLETVFVSSRPHLAKSKSTGHLQENQSLKNSSLPQQNTCSRDGGICVDVQMPLERTASCHAALHVSDTVSSSSANAPMEATSNALPFSARQPRSRPLGRSEQTVCVGDKFESCWRRYSVLRVKADERS